MYVAIFVCLATKAIHLEIVSDLSSEALIATLKRFFARRGKSSTIFSDNATNFRGARNVLSKLFKLAKVPEQGLSDYLLSEEIEWKFLPPRAPHFGGLWEAGQSSLTQHKIDTGDHSPIQQYRRRLPIAKQEEVRKLLKDMQESYVIKPSANPCSIVLTRKKANSTRFRVDVLKGVTKKDSYRLPGIDDILDILSGGK
ncbi:uncharacterized protein LOC118186646 [Stegodyphus dumicola]|uniref:uncharacterized protein LOC118186646 n=1 Tax=Stegodyphus dumicola TaxID=202533 RepID=UPI0015A7DEA8|nr:uncharacterized protein LOC118186646 [Stegodyphus dumicola]